MPSLNVDLDFFDHPKVKRLRALAGPQAEVFIMRLWAYAGKYHAADGILKDHGAAEIEALVNWTGNPGVMLEALLKVGFIILEEGQYKIKDWLEHEGHLAVYRERGRIAAESRWGKRRDNALSIASRTASSNAKAVHSKAENMAHIVKDNKVVKDNIYEAKPLIPTLAEVQEYCFKATIPVDPVRFWNHYQGQGWKLGNNPIHDWKAVLVKWTTQDHNPKQPAAAPILRAPKMVYEVPVESPIEDPRGWEPLK